MITGSTLHFPSADTIIFYVESHAKNLDAQSKQIIKLAARKFAETNQTAIDFEREFSNMMITNIGPIARGIPPSYNIIQSISLAGLLIKCAREYPEPVKKHVQNIQITSKL